MADRRPGTPDGGDGDGRRTAAPQGRDARLKAALKANIARRKARSATLEHSPAEPHCADGETPDPGAPAPQRTD